MTGVSEEKNPFVGTFKLEYSIKSYTIARLSKDHTVHLENTDVGVAAIITTRVYQS